MPPWEKYAQQPPSPPSPPTPITPQTGPWAKYQQAPTPAAAPTAVPQQDFSDLPVPGSPGFETQTQPSWTDAIMSGADYVDNTGANLLAGARSGVANTLGLPVDLINAAPMLFGQGPISQNPVGGSENLDWLFRAAGLIPDAPEPVDAIQRTARRIGQEVGAAAVPVGGVVAAYGNAGLKTAQQAPALARLFGAEAAAVNPANYLAKETAYATAAGAGAQAANEVFAGGEQNAISDVAGSVAGAGLLGIGNAAVGAARDLFAGATNNPNFASKVVNENVADTLIRNSDIMGRQVDPNDLTAPLDTADLVSAILRPNAVTETVPGFRPTTADASQDAGLALLEASRAKANPGPYRTVGDENTQAVEAAFQATQPSQPPSQFSNALETQRTQQIGDATQQVNTAQTAFDSAVRGLSPVMTGEGRGANIRTALEDASTAAKAIVSEAWRPLDQGADPVDMSLLRATFGEQYTPEALRPLTPDAANVPARLMERGVTTGGAPSPSLPDAQIASLAMERIAPGLASANDMLLNGTNVPPSLKSRFSALSQNGYADPGAWEDFLDAAYTLERNGALPRDVSDALTTMDTAYRRNLRDELPNAMSEVSRMFSDEVQSLRSGNGPEWAVEDLIMGRNPRDEGVIRAAYEAAKNERAFPAGNDNAVSNMQPISEVMGIRSALTNELRRDGITPQEVNIVEGYITRLDNYLDQNVPPELADQYSTARAATRDYYDRFGRPQTAIGQTLSERQGQPRYPDNSVARKFVQNDQGRISDFESMMREAGSDQRVQTAVRDQILQDVRDRNLLDDPTALNNYLGQYGTVFGRFPELRTELGNAGALRTALNDATTTQQNTIRDLTGPNSTVASYLKFGDERAQDAMRGVIANPDPRAAADELLNFVGNDPKSVEGARAAFWQVLENSSRSRNANAETASGIMPLLPRKMIGFLDNPANAAVAERLYRDNPEHLANIRSLAESLRDVNTGPRIGSAVNPSGTALLARGDPAVSMAEVQSKIWQAQIGRVNPLFVGTYLAGKLSRRLVGVQRGKAFDVLLDKALLNPDVAAALVRENNPANRAALAQSARGWLGNQASTIINALSDDEESDPTTSAIMRAEALN